MASPAEAKVPAGMSMMLKALGVDPQIIVKVAENVGKIADKLEAIENNQKKILALLAPESPNGQH
jgi:hypothetical protein